MASWNGYAQRLAEVFGRASFTDQQGDPLDADRAFGQWRDWAVELGQLKRSAYLIGNGASASMASHFAADLAKNARLHTQVFSDLSLITAISNDMGYEHVFAEPLRRRGQKGDMIVAISSSGRSPNILSAVSVARELQMTIITLSGMSPDNPLRRSGHLNIYLATESYGLVETGHAAVLHWWMDLVQLAMAGV